MFGTLITRMGPLGPESVRLTTTVDHKAAPTVTQPTTAQNNGHCLTIQAITLNGVNSENRNLSD